MTINDYIKILTVAVEESELKHKIADQTSHDAYYYAGINQAYKTALQYFINLKEDMDYEKRNADIVSVSKRLNNNL